MTTRDLSELDPALDHHRARWAELTRWKHLTLFVGVVGVTAAIVMAPDEARERTFWIGFGLVIGAFMLIELARFRVFLRDRRERGL
jgi:hypothetical protein